MAWCASTMQTSHVVFGGQTKTKAALAATALPARLSEGRGLKHVPVVASTLRALGSEPGAKPPKVKRRPKGASHEGGARVESRRLVGCGAVAPRGRAASLPMIPLATGGVWGGSPTREEVTIARWCLPTDDSAGE